MATMARISRRAFVLAAGAALGAIALVRPAAALTVDEAKRAGLIGEMPNGYLGVRTPGPGVQQLVDTINAQRRQRYQEIAASHGVPLAAVERQAGQALIQRAAPGEYYMNASNQWERR